MTEQITPPVDALDPAAAGGAGAGNPPEGFVSRAELEREQQRARTFQGELDRVKAQLEALAKAPKSDAKEDDNPGFDPSQFSQKLLNDVYRANAMVQASALLRAEFPKADPSLFSPERLHQYGSVDAFRIAVEADHNRVVAASSTEVQEALAKQRAELIAAYGAEPPAGPTGDRSGGGTGGEVTTQQLAAMSLTELAKFQKDHPGVAERLLGI